MRFLRGAGLMSVSVPAHGTAALVAGKVVYTPSATYAGPDSFTSRVTDSFGHTDTATVRM